MSLILGDNVFYGNMRLQEVYQNFNEGALVFGYPVSDPHKFGILEFDSSKRVIGIEEKPKNPKSRYAVPGLYLYDNQVVSIAEKLKPSLRGELEITDVNIEYLKKQNLKVELLGRGIAWLDTGSSDSLLDAGLFVNSINKRQSYQIGCPEEVALRQNFIDVEKYKILCGKMPDCDYKNYLVDLLGDIT